MTDTIIDRTIDDEEVRRSALYDDGSLAILQNVHFLNNGLAFRIQSNGLTLCLQGEAQLRANGKDLTLRRGDLFICQPDTVIENAVPSNDLETYSIALSADYIERLVLISGKQWDVKRFLDEHPVLPLNEDDITLFKQYYDLLSTKLSGPPRKHRKELGHALMLAFLYDFYDTIERFITFLPPTYTSGEKLFKKFTDLLATNYPRQRSVTWYAERLYVTPKYLSAIVKESCGQPASELIHRYVVKDIEMLLRSTRKSIKEIATELDFPNLSFFGKYVRHHLGCSPKQYRERLHQIDRV